MTETKEMKCVMLSAPWATETKTVPIPVPKEGQVLIKIMAAPINPSDLGLLSGMYPTEKKYPYSPGLEGCGEVVQSGGGAFADGILNKKVAFTTYTGSHGSYSQYTTIRASKCIPIDQEISFEQGSMSVVNPLTAYVFTDIMKRESHKSVVHTAAASQLGRMFIRLCREDGIEVINIVRRKEQVEILQKEGAKHILNSSDEDFEDQLKQLSSSLKTQICFDAIGGKMTGKVLSCMPAGSTIHVYGALANEAVGDIQIKDLLFMNKSVKGFILGSWTGSKSPQELIGHMKKMASQLKDSLHSKIAKEIPLEDIVKGVEFYRNNMSSGKVLIKPWI